MDQSLEKRISALEKWQQERQRQQIVFPLDFQSQTILGKYFMHIISTITTIGGAGGTETTQFIGQQNELEFLVSQNFYVPYTVNATSNIFSTPTAYFEDDMVALVATTDTAPAPLVVGTDYYVVNSTGNTFQLSATLGGAAIDITDTGTGRQFIYSFGF